MTGRSLGRTRRVLASIVIVALAGCHSSGQATRPPTARPSTTRPAGSGRCPAPTLAPGVRAPDGVLRYTPACVAYVRTPEARFASLPDFPYIPRYVSVDGLRMAYVDEGPRTGRTLVLLHGQPTWSYLYRKIIPPLVAAGYRVVAPDLIGMGRSDKPVEDRAYSYLHHVRWVEEFLAAAHLDKVVLLGQDWGALIGLRVVGDEPSRFAGVVISNGLFPDIPLGKQTVVLPPATLPNPALRLPFTVDATGWLRCDEQCEPAWVAYARNGATFHPAEVVALLADHGLRPDEQAAYDAPYPSRLYLTGPRIFPALIDSVGLPPTNAAAGRVLARFAAPFLTLFGRRDHNLGTAEVQQSLVTLVPGAKGQPHFAYVDASHYVMEDQPADFARRVGAFLATLGPP